MQKAILSGDEAVARAAWEAGVSVAAAYPGTPSTEILENITTYKDDIYCTWANNEKIATEIAIGASIGGMRALAAMKHVGMNVASDPIFSAAYTGVNGGLVIVSADDPGCHSSQNEQDNRLYAPHAKIGMLEPSDSQECKDFTKAAFELSERFDLIMMIRMTTRVCHSKSIVQLDQRENIQAKTYVSDPQKYAMLPVNARKRHIAVEANLEALKAYSYSSDINKTEINDTSIGIITSGISYMHAKEAFGDSASYLKLGITYPLSDRLIIEFAQKMKKIYVIEEGEGYLEEAVKALGIDCVGKQLLGSQGELNAQKVRIAFGLQAAGEGYATDKTAPPRPPVLCAGCPHRGFYHAMGKRKDKILAVGDIGCYSLGVNAPYNGFDIAICMGSGFSIPIGLSKALEMQNDTRKVFGILGDSTFFHSGFNSMVDAIHLGANVCLCVLDNSITAMTGHQENAGTQKNLMGYEVPAIDILQMIYSTGIDQTCVKIVDPIDQKAMGEAIDQALETDGPFVIVTKRPCALLKEVIKANKGAHCTVDPDKCVGCKACMKIACPAMAFEGKKANITDEASCTACGLCMQMCKFDAISKAGI
ncbi:MAG: indolepyruvate ferredoxin oxidoreductase subunit alpha [Clostridiales bacterium]|jgi:indolepyruvate ferredoxin oxidoreductase alpha subunit|nr:indolepyruvate ferredoxin oxidoreductase subunit alpha [Clostridiales bacterium]